MATYSYAPKKAPIPKGFYASVYGGHERTKLAGYPFETGQGIEHTILFTRDMSDDARRARIRARKRLGKTDLERALEETLAWLDAEETRNLKEFHNG